MSEQQLQKVRIKRLAQVGLWVTDVAAEARFYHHVLGFDLRTAPDGSSSKDTEALLALGDEHISCLGLFHSAQSGTRSDRKSTEQSRLHHLAFEVNTNGELAALAAHLNLSHIELTLEARDGGPEMDDILLFHDPDGNRIEISVTPDDLLSPSPTTKGIRRTRYCPQRLQHVALHTDRLEAMVEFYTEFLGFDISDWLLRECAWLRCNHDHHTLILTQGKPDIDHVGYSIPDGLEVLSWADHLGRSQIPVLWGPGRHGAGNDLFLRFADREGLQVEFSAGLQQYYDRDMTAPPRLWHTRSTAFNLWGNIPSWMHGEVNI